MTHFIYIVAGLAVCVGVLSSTLVFPIPWSIPIVLVGLTIMVLVRMTEELIRIRKSLERPEARAPADKDAKSGRERDPAVAPRQPG